MDEACKCFKSSTLERLIQIEVVPFREQNEVEKMNDGFIRQSNGVMRPAHCGLLEIIIIYWQPAHPRLANTQK